MLFSILYYYFQAKHFKHKFKSRFELENWQQKQLEKHWKWVKQNSVFYKNHNIEAWQNLPIINKEIMLENFNTLNTVGLTKEKAFNLAFESEKNRDFSKNIKNITIGLSSGTSGKKGLFIVNPDERAHWAGNILAKVLPKSIFKKCKIALFLRANSNLYTTAKTNHINFKFFDLMINLDENIKNLNEYKPNLLIAPPSVLKLLAKAQLKGQLQINPQKIVSAAEVLYETDKNFISSIFEQNIHQIYQATEGFLATTCEYGNLHLNEDLLYIQEEWIDSEKTRFYPIISDFTRKSQPMFRYKLNDILITSSQSKPCPCGSLFRQIDRIEGRSDEIIYLPSNFNSENIIIFPDFLIRALMKLELIDYKIVQINHLEIDFYLNFQNNLEEKKEEIIYILNNFFNSLNCQIPQINFKNLENQSIHNKFRRIENKYNKEN